MLHKNKYHIRNQHGRINRIDAHIVIFIKVKFSTSNAFYAISVQL